MTFGKPVSYTQPKDLRYLLNTYYGINTWTAPVPIPVLLVHTAIEDLDLT